MSIVPLVVFILMIFTKLAAVLLRTHQQTS